MNGQNTLSSASLANSANHNQLADRRRFALYLALTLSLMLHALLILFPYLGQQAARTKAIAQRQGTQHNLTALLLTQQQKNAQIKILPTDAGRPQSPQPGRSLPQKTDAPPVPEQSPSIGLDFLPIAGQTYFTTDQLSRPPEPVEEVSFDTPEIPTVSQSGKIILKMWINVRGTIDRVEIEQTELPPGVTESIINVFKQSKFAPGERNNQPVGTMMRIQVDYESKPPKY